MLSQKWLELLQHLQDGTHEFVEQGEAVERLSTKYSFLKSQFCNISKSEDPAQIDWLEHETFTSVMGEITKECSFTADEMDFIFNCLLSAKLAQLALTMINNHEKVLTEADFSFKRALVLQRLGESELARKALEKTLELEPGHHLAICHLGFIALYSGNLEQAIDYFSACVEKAPDFIGGYQNLAGCHYQNSDFEAAATYCEDVYRLDQTIEQSYVTAISCFLALDDLDSCLNWLERASAHNINSIELFRLRGMVAFLAKDYPQAIDHLSTYLTFYQDNLDVLEVRAKALAATEDWENLKPDLLTLLEVDPFDSWGLEQLFLCYFHTSEWTKAEEVMVQLTKISGHYRISYNSQINRIRQEQQIPLTETK
ncbi:tetratricopeptide repeat protein [Photobacterium sp. SDRW27]|uniref:tetratricopeptide repeat protein n=1 Tax=Photobacterium obscurum TaxID=2829490 RepID=UPI002243FD00|nr:tetratricopeptide repeat protein [Photobacterium obscurum]MCW8331396.1 tetratricopeptide repeat protein [Photobacterium obscurum]